MVQGGVSGVVLAVDGDAAAETGQYGRAACGDGEAEAQLLINDFIVLAVDGVGDRAAVVGDAESAIACAVSLGGVAELESAVGNKGDLCANRGVGVKGRVAAAFDRVRGASGGVGEVYAHGDAELTGHAQAARRARDALVEVLAGCGADGECLSRQQGV